jgi:hypothetical protein
MIVFETERAWREGRFARNPLNKGRNNGLWQKKNFPGAVNEKAPGKGGFFSMAPVVNNGRLGIDSGLKKGIYFVKVTSEGMNFTQKLIVQ